MKFQNTELNLHQIFIKPNKASLYSLKLDLNHLQIRKTKQNSLQNTYKKNSLVSNKHLLDHMESIEYSYLQQIMLSMSSFVIPFEESHMINDASVVIYSDASYHNKQAGFAFVIKIKLESKFVLLTYQSKNITWHSDIHFLQLASALLAIKMADKFHPQSISVWVDNPFTYITLANSGFQGEAGYLKKLEKYRDKQVIIDMSNLNANHLRVYKQTQTKEQHQLSKYFSKADLLSKEARQKKNEKDQWLLQFQQLDQR